MDKKIIGIDLGGTTAKFAILTPEGEIQQNGASIPIFWMMVSISFLKSLNQSTIV